MNNFEIKIDDILNDLNSYLGFENRKINNIEENILNLIKKKNSFESLINFFTEKLNHFNDNKKYKVLFIFEDIFTFIIFFILLKYFLSYKKEKNFYNLTFFINYNKEIILENDYIILIFNEISSFQKIVFNYFDELFFLDSKINIIKKDIFLSFLSLEELNELKKIFSYNNNGLNLIINDDENKNKNFFDNVKKILDIIKIKNLSAFSSAIQNEQYLRNFFKNLSFIKQYNNTNIYSINNIYNKNINIFGASPKLNFFINLTSNYLNKLNNYINFSIISNIDLFLKNNIKMDFIFNFDTNFYAIFSFQKLFKNLNYFKNTKLNFVFSLFCYPHLLNKSFKYNKNLNIILFNFNTLLEKLVFNEIKLNNSYFSGTSINMLINFFDVISTEKKNKFEINIFGSDYENLDFNFNKVSHHKLYPLFYYLLKRENYIKNIISWETKNIFYSKAKHDSYKLDLLNKNYNFLSLNFIKDIKQYQDFFSDYNKENKIKGYDLNLINKEKLIQNINNLKNSLNNFLFEIENFIVKEKDENILNKFYYKTANQNKNNNSLNSDLFKELFFREIYFYLIGRKTNFKSKLYKLKKYISLI